MAIETIFMDGFDQYEHSVSFDQPNGVWEDSQVYIGTTAGREGGQAFYASHRNPSPWALYNIGATYRLIVVGFAIRFNNAIPDLVADAPIALRDDDNAAQLTLRVKSDGYLELLRGTSSGTVLATGSTTQLVPASWYYIELRAFIDNTTGAYEVKIDGTTEFSGTSADTQATSNNYVDRVLLGFGKYSVGDLGKYIYVDDFYIRGDTTTNTAGGFWGDVRIKAYSPDADGTHGAWTRSTGTTDYENIDDINVTSYTGSLYTGTLNNKYTVTHENVSAGGNDIKAVGLTYQVQMKTGGTREIEALCVSGATTDNGTSQRVLQYRTMPQVVYDTDPNTAAAWTETNLNNAEFGLEVSA